MTSLSLSSTWWVADSEAASELSIGSLKPRRSIGPKCLLSRGKHCQFWQSGSSGHTYSSDSETESSFETSIGEAGACNMAMMTELFYEGKEPAWSYSAYYDYADHNHRHELDPQYTQDYMTRDMKPPIKIKCCRKCEDRLREALRNTPGVDSVVSAYNNKKLVVTGSADYYTIHYALKHIRKRHHHYLPQKLHNPFRLLFPRHSHSLYTPSWNHASSAGASRRGHNYYDNNVDTNSSKYGHGYGQAPEHHYKPGSLLQILFDSRRSSHHNHSGYTHY